MESFPSLAGQALIAMPSIGDARFERSVIYMCVHDENGAMGVVVNRPDKSRVLADIVQELDLVTPGADGAKANRIDNPILQGGPVETSRGFVLHSPHLPVREGTVAVTSDVHLSTKIDILRDIATAKGPQDYLFALGFANWGAGQLDDEILQNAWLHAPMSAAALFETPPELHYAAGLSTLGVDVTKLSLVAGRG